MITKRYKVFVESSAEESRINGIAPMGFAFLIFGAGIEPTPNFGYGAEKDTQAMLAHGLQTAAHEIFLEWETPQITTIRNGVGVHKFLTDFVPNWLRKISDGAVGFSRHSLEVWRKLYELSLLGNLTMRTPESSEEEWVAHQMKGLAKRSAQSALVDRQQNKSRYATLGVFVTGKCQVQPKSS